MTVVSVSPWMMFRGGEMAASEIESREIKIRKEKRRVIKISAAYDRLEVALRLQEGIECGPSRLFLLQ